jgi:putative flavoprotein involved in K+ transport
MRNEVIAYLSQYAAKFDLPIELNSVVRSLRAENGSFRVELDGRQVLADQLIVATGAFPQPRTPSAKQSHSRHKTLGRVKGGQRGVVSA